MRTVKHGELVRLKRGGYLIDTSVGYIQIGSPPETIKDTMSFEKGVPTIFCLPKIFFHRNKGISVAEVEFPLYFNFFIRKKKTKLISTEENVSIFREVLKESLFGPETFNLVNDYDDNAPYEVPNLKAEMDYFRNGLALDDLVEFLIFDDERKVNIEDVIIELDHDQNFLFKDISKRQMIKVPGEIEYKVEFDLGGILSTPFKPSKFEVTCLGPSHGFDPEDNTSGFILWLNGHGVMIDPPVNTTEWLVQSNVNPKLIDTVILTHTHADHDAGTFQKILEEDKVTIFSTTTIMDSWLRKYSILTGIETKSLTQLFDFHPVLIGDKVNIHGAWFSFNYTLHSIPTIGFRMTYRDKSFVYTSDHLNLPSKFEELKENKIISPNRYKELMDFPWESDVIYHEAGVPPLHTPIEYLNTIDTDIQKKTVVYHIAQKDFPDMTGLTLATFGIGNSLKIDVKEGVFESAYSIIDVFSRIEIFKDFTASKLKDLLAVVDKENIPKGTRIIKKGEYGNKFYTILSGSIRVGSEKAQNGESKRFGNYQSFGEASLLLNQPRAVDVFAETDVEALSISRNAFLNLIEGTEIENKLKTVALNRNLETWKALSATDLFPKLTSAQKTELEMLLVQEKLPEDTLLLEKGKTFKNLYIFHSGEVIIDQDEQQHFCEIGDIIGNYKEFELSLPSTITARAKKDSLVFRLRSNAFRQYVKKNPGVYLRFFEAMIK